MAETVVVAVVSEAVEVTPVSCVVAAIEAEVSSLVRPAMVATHDHSGGGII